MLVHRPADDFIPHPFLHGQGLTRDQALVHAGRALHDDAVHGDGLAGPDAYQVAGAYLLNGHFHFRAVPYHPRGVRLEGQQAAHGLRRARAHEQGHVARKNVVSGDKGGDREEVGCGVVEAGHMEVAPHQSQGTSE